MTQAELYRFPEHLLICPVCATSIQHLQCHKCNSEFFALGDIPCVFTTGIQQKHLWQHQLAMMQEQGADALAHIEYVLQGYDISALTRERLEQSYDAMKDSLQLIIGQLHKAGLRGARSAAFEGQNIDNPTEYYHHILRDWAWDGEPSKHYETHVNDANLQRLAKVWPQHTNKKILFLGAGAGRLSWDVHAQKKPHYSIAADINPFLLSCADTLIHKRLNLVLPELYTYPQIGYPYAKSWHMAPPADPDNLHNSWYALGADVWNMPFRKGSFDTVVSSWLLDVTGGDVKDLIEVISYLLEPGGLWVNTGPLLYSSRLAFDIKYSAEEILDFTQMAGFDVGKQSVDEIAHMASPLNARYHHEQVLSFAASKRLSAKPIAKVGRDAAWLHPAWLIMHHQPIPKIDFQCQMGHEFIEQVLALVDGEKSIYAIAQIMQPHVPDGVDAKDAIVALFGQILEQMAGLK